MSFYCNSGLCRVYKYQHLSGNSFGMHIFSKFSNEVFRRLHVNNVTKSWESITVGAVQQGAREHDYSQQCIFPSKTIKSKSNSTKTDTKIKNGRFCKSKYVSLCN